MVGGSPSPFSAEIGARIALASPDPIFAVDRGGRVTFWNDAMARLTGLPAAKVHRKPLRECLPTMAASREEVHLAAALSGTPVRSTDPFFSPPHEGEAQFLEAQYSPLRGEDGAVVGVCAVLHDVTESHRAEELREESESRFRTMADGAPVLLWMSEPNALCTFFNQGWLDFTGRTMEMEWGNGWAEGVHPEDFQRCMTIYMNAFVDRREFRMEYRLRRADGQYRWILDTGRPRLAPDGTFEGYIGSCIDITEIRDAALALHKMNVELEDRVERRTAELKHSHSELESFSYTVSHDLRAPLRAIEGFSSLLLASTAGKLDAQGTHFLDRIRSSCLRMSELIDGLLALSRLTRTQMTVKPVDLTALAQSVVEELRASTPDRKVDVVIAERMVATGDAHLLRVVLSNLIGNSWKFTSRRPSARIEVGSGVHDGVPAYFVRDNGAGFDMEYSAKLFQVFKRLHRPDEFEGTGIGLATVRRIVERHGGRTWAEGRVDGGATFYFTL